MGDATILRDFRQSDLDPMLALDIECFPTPFRFSKDDLRRFVKTRGALTLVAEDSSGVVGFIIVHADRSLASAYVVTLDVRQTCRRTGLGSRLMREAERLAGANGVLRMRLHVYSQNVKAQLFYERLGYDSLGLEPGFYGATLDAVVMERSLPLAVKPSAG